MGVVLAKFRKERTTEEVLEKLDERIQVLESYMHNTEEQKKRFVGNFLAFSIGIYMIALIVVYFRYFPTTWKEILLYIVPLLLVPFVIFRLRRVFTWYFQRKLNKNSDQLISLRAEKRKILEQVMDKETYKVAVNLLSRFGDKNQISKPSFALTPRPTQSASQLRLRSNPSINVQTPTSNPLPSLRTLSTPNFSATPSRLLLGSSNRLGAEERDGVALSTERTFNSPSPNRNVNLSSPRVGNELARRRTPFPVINHQDKTVFERIVDVLIGDGPQDRFALICKECFAHNGMAPKDEFEYVAFRCAFCNAMNPARKARPIAPRLSYNPEPRRNSTDTPTSSSSENECEAPILKTSSEENLKESTKTDSSDTKDSEVIVGRSCDNNNDVDAATDDKLQSSLLDVLKKENFIFKRKHFEKAIVE